ncbi:MAG: hypothetical protein VW518_00135 [Burkholderiaceae bacterium]
MDPITALATISAVWAGIKKGVELGREVQDVWSQLSAWAQAADVLEQASERPAKPSIFNKLNFGDDTKQAFDAYAAKVKMREMEAEIRHEFLYGGLCHLGMDGLKEFYNIRRQVRERRIKAIQDQRIQRQAFVEACVTVALVLAGSVAVIFILWMTVELISGGKL